MLGINIIVSCASIDPWGSVIDILYTLDIASNYSAIQKLKLWLQSQDIPMEFYILSKELKTRSKLNWDFPKYAISRICFKLCRIFLFFRKILMLSQNMCKNKRSLRKNWRINQAVRIFFQYYIRKNWLI
jgi:hypothetical protein